jgi:hypothetical protein
MLFYEAGGYLASRVPTTGHPALNGSSNNHAPVHTRRDTRAAEPKGCPAMAMDLQVLQKWRKVAVMPHIAPVILKRRPGFLGTPKRPPPWALGTGIGRAPLRCLLVVPSASPSSFFGTHSSCVLAEFGLPLRTQNSQCRILSSSREPIPLPGRAPAEACRR